jgi:hypothetical protein
VRRGKRILDRADEEGGRAPLTSRPGPGGRVRSPGLPTRMFPRASSPRAGSDAPGGPARGEVGASPPRPRPRHMRDPDRPRSGRPRGRRRKDRCAGSSGSASGRRGRSSAGCTVRTCGNRRAPL